MKVHLQSSAKKSTSVWVKDFPIHRECVLEHIRLNIKSLSGILQGKSSGGHVHSQTLRMCRTVVALSNSLMRDALIGCSGGRICSLNVAGTRSGLARMQAIFFRFALNIMTCNCFLICYHCCTS